MGGTPEAKRKGKRRETAPCVPSIRSARCFSSVRGPAKYFGKTRFWEAGSLLAYFWKFYRGFCEVLRRRRGRGSEAPVAFSKLFCELRLSLVMLGRVSRDGARSSFLPTPLLKASRQGRALM